MSIAGEGFNLPFSLPLSREQFGSALRKGQGRALMHVLRHGAADVEDLIIEACIHDPTFDRQCEADRAPWMAELLKAGGLEARACEQLVPHLLAQPTESTHDPDHMSHIAMKLAGRGRADARAALYAAFEIHLSAGKLVGVDSIIELDGAGGLLQVADKIGRQLEATPQLALCRLPIHWYDRCFEGRTAEQALQSAAEGNESIAAFLRLASAQRVESLPPAEKAKARLQRVRNESANDVIHEIESGHRQLNWTCYSRWGREATPEDLDVIATRLFTASEPYQISRLLGVFHRRALPQFDPRLLQFADHAEQSVRWASHWALAHYRNPEVRRLAMDRLYGGRHAERELRLLIRNYQPGDWPLIRDSLRWPEDECHLHWILGDVLEIFEANPQDAREPLLLIYLRTPCMNCRGHAVAALVKRQQAPDWLIEECRFDADEQIRQSAVPPEPPPAGYVQR